MDITFEPQVESVLREVETAARGAGLKAWVVGGAVRDALLGVPTRDLDITVEDNAIGLALTLRERWGASSTVHTAFGTAEIVRPDGYSLDFVSARSETYAQPGSLPTVTFAGLREDLERRDFTVNAMAASLSADGFGTLVDPLGGYRDLQDGTLRIMHRESFVDDPTRLFRAGRYAVRYRLKPDPLTDRAARAAVQQGALWNVSADRRRAEIELICAEPCWVDIVRWLQEWGAWDALQAGWHPPDNLLRRADVVHAWANRHLSEDGLPDLEEFRWLVLMLTAPDSVATALSARPNETLTVARARRVAEIREAPATPEWWRRLDNKPLAAVLCALVSARTDGDKRRLTEYLERVRPLRLSITGHDLLAHGAAPGPEVGASLTETLDALRTRRIETREEQLEYARRALERSAGAGKTNA